MWDFEMGSVVFLGDLTLLNSTDTYTLANAKRKHFIFATPLNKTLNRLILVLKASVTENVSS